MAIEGRLTDEGLISMADSEDPAVTLAKSLNEGGISGVEATWRNLSRRSAPLGGSPQHHPEPQPEVSAPVPAPPADKPKPRPKTNATSKDPRRLDPAADWGPGYRWTKAGWRKIPQREIEAKARKAEQEAADAWKRDPEANPGEGYRWQKEYSYARNGKTVTVRGHWRRKGGKANG
jgi:hypothetical protein